MREREIISKIKKLHKEQALEETILRFLRSEKATKINSIRLLHLATGISLGEAKVIVFRSETWSDRRESDAAFVDTLLETVESDRTAAA